MIQFFSCFENTLFPVVDMSNFAAVRKGQKSDEPSSSSGAVAGRDAMGRRVWDKDYFKQKFEEEEGSSLQPRGKVAKIVSGPTSSLKERELSSVDLEANLNEKKVLSITASKAEQGGFFCQVCDSHHHDSDAYLAHLNSKTHNRMLGMSMKVEKVPVERIREKLRAMRPDLVKKFG